MAIVMRGEEAAVLRTMAPADVDAVLEIQEPAAVRGLAAVFPQDAHPFPRDAVADRWRVEIADPDTHCYVVLLDDTVAGFAATRRDELLHFGTALEHWGSGLATSAHDAVLDRLRHQGHQSAWLRVFTDNPRARRFYGRLGWQETGERTRSTFAPYPELIRCARRL